MRKDLRSIQSISRTRKWCLYEFDEESLLFSIFFVCVLCHLSGWILHEKSIKHKKQYTRNNNAKNQINNFLLHMIISRLGADISFYKKIVYRKTHGYCLLKSLSRNQSEYTNISHSNTQFVTDRSLRSVWDFQIYMTVYTLF